MRLYGDPRVRERGGGRRLQEKRSSSAASRRAIAGSTASEKGSKVFAFMLKKTLGVDTATALLARDDEDKAMDEAPCPAAGTDSRGLLRVQAWPC